MRVSACWVQVDVMVAFRYVALILSLAASGLTEQTPRVLPPGTTINVELDTNLASKTAKIGDPVRAKVEQQIKLHGAVLLAKNSYLLGAVTEDSLAKPGKMASFGVLFTWALANNGAVLMSHLRAAIVRIYPISKEPDRTSVLSL
jgi:hypothetical protein